MSEIMSLIQYCVLSLLYIVRSDLNHHFVRSNGVCLVLLAIGYYICMFLYQSQAARLPPMLQHIEIELCFYERNQKRTVHLERVKEADNVVYAC